MGGVCHEVRALGLSPDSTSPSSVTSGYLLLSLFLPSVKWGSQSPCPQPALWFDSDNASVGTCQNPPAPRRVLCKL